MSQFRTEYEKILRGVEDENFYLREGLRDTPERASKALEFLTSGYDMTLEEVTNDAFFDNEKADEMIIVKDIEFYSLCEHHILPFMGKVHVGYIPTDKVIGLSKIPRIVDMYARRLQIQERLTQQIADCLVKVLNPKGCGVVVSGQHMCMAMRGIQKQDAYMITNALKGVFKVEPETRAEFMNFIGK